MMIRILYFIVSEVEFVRDEEESRVKPPSEQLQIRKTICLLD